MFACAKMSYATTKVLEFMQPVLEVLFLKDSAFRELHMVSRYVQRHDCETWR